MSFDLKSICPTRRDIPSRTTIHGDSKVGKSTFGAGAPDVIFLVTEDGQDAIDAQAFPKCETWEDLITCIATLHGEHSFRNVVLDSADWAEKLARKHIIATVKHEKDKNKVIKSIEDYGYGKGYIYTADLFLDMLDGLNSLRLNKGMGVIVTAHSEIRRFDDPLSDSYDRYQIKMHKAISRMLMEWSDVIGFAQIESVTQEEEVGFNDKKVRAVDIGRVLRLSPSAAYDAGNRYGLPDTLPLEYAAFASAMDAARNPPTQQGKDSNG